jgi:hypothetical protein
MHLVQSPFDTVQVLMAAIKMCFLRCAADPVMIVMTLSAKLAGWQAPETVMKNGWSWQTKSNKYAKEEERFGGERWIESVECCATSGQFYGWWIEIDGTGD